MERDSTNPPGFGQRSANLLELNTPCPGERVRVLSGDLRGLEGTVICRRANGRLLIKPRAIRGGIYVEIDARVIEHLDGPEI